MCSATPRNGLGQFKFPTTVDTFVNLKKAVQYLNKKL